MEAVSLVLVLLLSDGTTAGRATMLDTLSRSLDPALVQLQPRVLGTAPRDVLDELSDTHPVVEIRWENPRRAVLRAALKPREWTTRTVDFGARDPLAERGKTLGFAVAAMLPQWRAQTSVADPPALEVVPLSARDFFVPLLADAGVADVPDAGVVIEPEPPPMDAGVVIVEAPTPAPTVAPAASRGFVSVIATGQLPQVLGGGGVDGAYCVIDWLCVGAQVTVGGGSFPSPAISHLEMRALAIADVRVYPWASPFGLTARGSAGAVLIAATRGGQSLTRWTATGGVEAGVSLRISPIELTLTGGPAFSGPTALVVDGVQVSEIAAVQGALRLGASWRF